MSKPVQNLLTVFLALFISGVSHAQTAAPRAAEEETATFVFRPQNDMFFQKGNEAELERLHALVDKYKAEIAAGRLPVHVDGYCASLPSAKENLKTAYIRANRVKSELITRKGLKEADFITTNHAQAYDGRRDLVVVTLRIPAEETPQPEVAMKKEPVREEPPMETAPRTEPPVEKEPQPEPEPEIVSEPAPAAAAPAARTKPYCFAVRTNVLYDALLLPTLGVEWRINRHIGVKLDGSLARWGNEHGKVQKMWLLNPEVRWYLLKNKRFYTGVSGNYGQYNVYKYAIGSIVSKDTGYQGTMWGAGLTVGYQLDLSRRLLIDFNLGLGYTRFEHDTFGIIDGVRVYKGRDCTKNFWGPTQAGVSLVWTIGGKR